MNIEFLLRNVAVKIIGHNLHVGCCNALANLHHDKLVNKPPPPPTSATSPTSPLNPQMDQNRHMSPFPVVYILNRPPASGSSEPGYHTSSPSQHKLHILNQSIYYLSPNSGKWEHATVAIPDYQHFMERNTKLFLLTRRPLLPNQTKNANLVFSQRNKSRSKKHLRFLVTTK